MSEVYYCENTAEAVAENTRFYVSELFHARQFGDDHDTDDATT